MDFGSQAGVIVLTPEGRVWAKQYLCQEDLFVVSGLNLDVTNFSDLLSNEIEPSHTGVIATVDSVYKKGTAEEQQFTVQVLVKWEFM